MTSTNGEGTGSTKPRKASTVAALVIGLLLGAVLLWHGLDALVSGEILVRPKSKPAFMAYRDGPTADRFLFEAWMRIVAGSLADLICGTGLAILVFGGPERRTRYFAVFDGERKRVRRLMGFNLSWPGVTIGLLVAVAVFVVVSLAV